MADRITPVSDDVARLLTDLMRKLPANADVLRHEVRSAVRAAYGHGYDDGFDHGSRQEWDDRRDAEKAARPGAALVALEESRG